MNELEKEAEIIEEKKAKRTKRAKKEPKTIKERIIEDPSLLIYYLVVLVISVMVVKQLFRMFV